MHTDLRFGDFANVLSDVSNVDLVLTSPPYNIGSKQKKSIGGRCSGGYDAKNFGGITEYPDNMPEEDYQAWQVDTIVKLSTLLSDDGVIAYNHKIRHSGTIVKGHVVTSAIHPLTWIYKAMEEANLCLVEEIIWDRGSTMNHTKARCYDQSERLWILCKQGARVYFRNQPFYWENGENKGVGNVWRIPPDVRNEHNAPFPEKFARQIIKMWCPPGGLVCDPFTGSGTTMISAIKEGCSFVGAEKTRKYYHLSMANRKQALCQM